MRGIATAQARSTVAPPAVGKLLAGFGIAWAVLVWLALVFLYRHAAIDVEAYWSVDLSAPYRLGVGEIGAFPYSPLAAQLFAAAQVIPFPVFHAAWIALLIAIVLWLLPPRWWAVGVGYAIPELAVGNVHLLIALALVVAFTRSSAAWALPLLTKVTPGVGILWHLFRREWRALMIAAGFTLALVGVSFLLSPSLWFQWLAYLADSAGREAAVTIEGPRLHIPLVMRLGVAVGIVAVAAWKDKAWLVPVAVMVGLPVVWMATAYTVLYAIARLRRTGVPVRQDARCAEGG